MIDRVDLVMWTKNGAETLPLVLKRIDEVIPDKFVDNRIIVDDHSTDDTPEIAKSFGWQVIPNEGSGISSGANTALKHVTSEYFISFEQDLLLARDWWQKIPKHMEDNKVAVAQGIRISTDPTLRILDEYVYSRMTSDTPIRFGVSMDNNIFRTKIIEESGGFPSECPVCTDTILMKKIVLETPYKWIVDRTVVSDHIRQSVKYYLQHCYKLGKLCTHSRYCVTPTLPPLLSLLRLFMTSPLRASAIAWKKHEPRIFWVYPSVRWMKLKGFLDRERKLNR